MSDPPEKGKPPSADQAFIFFVKAIFILMLCWGVATTILVLWADPSNVTQRVLITAWSGMFTGLIGLGAGYLLGRATK